MKLPAPVGLFVMLLCVSCIPSRPSAASREIESVRSRFPTLATWVQDNRDDLELIVSEIEQEEDLRRLAWSRNEYVTATFKDDAILRGYFESSNWPKERKAIVETWFDRLRKAGCHGFDYAGANWGMRLYLDVNVYIGIPASENRRLIESYESWISKGNDVRGDICLKLDGGWYLCSYRR